MLKTMDDLSAANLRWLVENRSRNQEASLVLFGILAQYLDQTPERSFLTEVGQGLVAVGFSLWRAVFLVDETQKAENRFRDSVSFLGKVILDNTITYAQDRMTRDWTFWYYLNNARYRLERIFKDLQLDLNDATFPRLLPTTTPRQRWELLHAQYLRAIEELKRKLELEQRRGSNK